MNNQNLNCQLEISQVFVITGLQVYNEQIRDLLANVGPLAVREDPSKGVVIQGLTLHQVSDRQVICCVCQVCLLSFFP